MAAEVGGLGYGRPAGCPAKVYATSSFSTLSLSGFTIMVF
jgi:hypothetical protein